MYAHALLVAFDQLINALLLGSPDETLSSRAYRADRDGKVFGRIFRPAIDTIFSGKRATATGPMWPRCSAASIRPTSGNAT